MNNPLYFIFTFLKRSTDDSIPLIRSFLGLRNFRKGGSYAGSVTDRDKLLDEEEEEGFFLQ